MLFERFDSNHDNSLDYDEFISFVSYDEGQLYVGVLHPHRGLQPH